MVTARNINGLKTIRKVICRIKRSEFGWCALLGVLDVPSNPRRISATVDHGENQNRLRIVRVVNRKGKPVGKRPVEASISFRIIPKNIYKASISA